EAAASNSKIMPDAVDIARPIQATRRVCARTTIAAGLAGAETASATNGRKVRAPVMVAVAAKCIARTTIRGPSIPAPSQFIGVPLALRTDLKREIIVGRVRIHREDAPSDMVCSSAPRA